MSGMGDWYAFFLGLGLLCIGFVLLIIGMITNISDNLWMPGIILLIGGVAMLLGARRRPRMR